jgi:phosphatidylglycerophosphatase C
MVEGPPVTVAANELIDELSSTLGDADPAGVVLSFDGDGTLWSGDVGEDLMREALSQQFLQEEALPALRQEAERHRVALDGAHDANAVAGTLVAAYLAGQYPERETCEMMTWCYAGRTLAEVQALAASVLVEEELSARLHDELQPILEWSRGRGLRSVLISASPRAIVEPAAALWGFAPGDVAAATPAIEGGRVLPRMASPVPYAENKLRAGRALFGNARWLAAFGDNVFDIDMLTTAEVGVAVRPKPKLASEVLALKLRLLARA